MRLHSAIQFAKETFPDTALGVHWQDKHRDSILWDDSYQVGRIRPAFGGGYWVEPYWRKGDNYSIDTEEEAKAYLVTLYRMEK